MLDVQVRGTLVRVLPILSVTVALTVADEPRRNDVVEEGVPATFSEIDCMVQVVNGRGCDVTPPVVAKMEVVPGVAATAVS